ERVVPARLRRVAMAEQVGRDDGEATSELREHRLPGRRRARDPVDEDEQRPAPHDPVAQPVPVEMDLGGLGHRCQRIWTPEIARAMTSRWISDVPSKIV